MNAIDSGFVIAVITVLTLTGGVVVWFMRLQSQLDSKLSYQRHEEICSESHAEKMAAIREIREMIERNEEAARLERRVVRDEMHSLALKITELTVQQKIMQKQL